MGLRGPEAAPATRSYPIGMSTFVAIDFETATARRDSACAVGLAACCSGRVVLARTYLIRPPRPQFTFTEVHGLRWQDVEHAPDFAELWPVLHAWIRDAAFLAAHNAKFDRAVLNACCARYRLRPPSTLFTCTVQLARGQWGIRPTSLPEVCRRLRIPLRHHDAGADALACARVVLAAQAAGWRRSRRRKRRTQRISAAPWFTSQSLARGSVLEYAPHHAQDANTEGAADCDAGDATTQAAKSARRTPAQRCDPRRQLQQ